MLPAKYAKGREKKKSTQFIFNFLANFRVFRGQKYFALENPLLKFITNALAARVGTNGKKSDFRIGIIAPDNADCAFPKTFIAVNHIADF